MHHFDVIIKNMGNPKSFLDYDTLFSRYLENILESRLISRDIILLIELGKKLNSIIGLIRASDEQDTGIDCRRDSLLDEESFSKDSNFSKHSKPGIQRFIEIYMNKVLSSRLPDDNKIYLIQIFVSNEISLFKYLINTQFSTTKDLYFSKILEHPTIIYALLLQYRNQENTWNLLKHMLFEYIINHDSLDTALTQLERLSSAVDLQRNPIQTQFISFFTPISTKTRTRQAIETRLSDRYGIDIEQSPRTLVGERQPP